MSNSLLLVASANGLGHARRLFYIHHEFLSQGIQSELLVNSFQFNKCKSEFSIETLDKIFISNSKFGLDGPYATFEDREELDFTLMKICNAENIISDNLIWPAYYNSNVFIHGHFTWVDYWHKILEFNSIKSPPELDFEANLRKEVRAWFAPKTFKFSQTFPDNKLVLLPLIRYPNDVNYEKFVRNWKEIWVSVGTTKDKDFVDLESVLKSFLGLGFSIRYEETHRFHDLKLLPGLVIGRPGLGTIRDCLASGTAFLSPISENGKRIPDPELSNNLETLSIMGLLPSLESISVRKLQKFSDIYRAFWAVNSCPISDYSNKILQSVSEMRR